jgi:hypothetical protein
VSESPSPATTSVPGRRVPVSKAGSRLPVHAVAELLGGVFAVVHGAVVAPVLDEAVQQALELALAVLVLGPVERVVADLLGEALVEVVRIAVVVLRARVDVDVVPVVLAPHLAVLVVHLLGHVLAGVVLRLLVAAGGSEGEANGDEPGDQQ